MKHCITFVLFWLFLGNQSFAQLKFPKHEKHEKTDIIKQAGKDKLPEKKRQPIGNIE